ncbi:MSGN1 protein, partial [Atractosteus spatula]|nr:MSGN1 protein [Atractosteus spatula]
MENLPEDALDLDSDLDHFTSKILVDWNWTTEETGQGPSPHSMSPESSFDSMCSSPETAHGVVGYQTAATFPYHLPLHSSAASSSSQGRKPAKPKMTTKRRMKASEREKMRMRSLADALHQLRDYLPPDYSQRGQPLTKIQTLKYTIQYINELSDLLRKPQELQ